MSSQIKGSRMYSIKNGPQASPGRSLFKFYGKATFQMTSLENPPTKGESPYQIRQSRHPRPLSVSQDRATIKIQTKRTEFSDNNKNYEGSNSRHLHKHLPINIFKKDTKSREYLPSLATRKISDYSPTAEVMDTPPPVTCSKHKTQRLSLKKLDIFNSNRRLHATLRQAPLRNNAYQIRWFDQASGFASIDSRLIMGSLIGEGGFAKVYEARDRATNQLVAAKVFDKRLLTSASLRKNLQNEINVLGRLDHPAIVKLIKVIEDQNSVCLIMEHWGTQTLKSWVETNGWDSSAQTALRDVGNALVYMHSCSVFHRDIKMTNLMVKEGRGCLIDFGMATDAIADSKEYLFCGTSTYQSPEMVARVGYKLPPNDVWGFVVTLYRASSGLYPFGGSVSSTRFKERQGYGCEHSVR